ncbi:MAG TPA: sulfite exporter TauE/SafE family protein [Ignavibacteria bacterium]|nr:sulfite exporter TauE/SafE family protein [Ignavibacteria bacterium]
MELLTGFLLGFLGSFHCIGMCGPLVLALPYSPNLIASRLLHNTGRVITYGMFGLVFGLIGSRLYLAGLQQIFSVALGVIIIITIILPHRIKSKFLIVTGLNKLLLVLKKKLSELYKSKSLFSKLGIGILNGFLPCGFVYMALTGALIVGSVPGSALFMIMFGIGTIPAMLAVSLAGKLITLNVRDKFRKLIPAFSVLIALLFILRGLNLGIPYISPKLENFKNTSDKIICH